MSSLNNTLVNPDVKKQYKILDKYVLRTHIISSSEVSKLTIAKIKEYCGQPFISEAIFLASPELHAEMLKYLEGQKTTNETRLVHTLLRYLLRMGNRCTPFGLFAGYSIGKVEDETRIELDEIDRNKRYTRLDMSYLCLLAQELEQNKTIRENLKYYGNSSIYELGDELRYIETKHRGTKSSHYTSAIDNSKYVDIILKACVEGAYIEDLAKLLVEPEISLFDAKAFIHQLIDNQILVSEITPSVTGTDYFTVLRKKIPHEKIQNHLNLINEQLLKLDACTTKNRISSYERILETFDQLGVAYDKKHLLQTDMIIATKENTISSTVVEHLHEAIAVLNKLMPYKKDEKLANFKKRFYNKFEDEQIPLALALDVETGISYSFGEHNYDISPLISGLTLFGDQPSQDRELNWSKTDSYLHKKLLNLDTSNGTEMVISEADLASFKENWDNLPSSFNAMVSLLNNSTSEPLLHLSFAGGPSATYMLGRFSQKDREMESLLTEITNEEVEAENVVLAEIAHLPSDTRMGNIIARNHLRDYEIPYLSQSNLPKANQIPIDDILISIKEDRIVLFSKKLNKEIKPKMASAHNFSTNTLPIYNFLCDVQAQDKRYAFEFDWGNARIGRSFLPRVRYKNVILASAEWVITKSEIQKTISSETLLKLRKKRGLPKKVLLKDFDNELLIDFEHELSVEMFLVHIKTKNQLMLIEYLQDEHNALVKKEDMSFNNEILFSFVKNANNLS